MTIKELYRLLTSEMAVGNGDYEVRLGDGESWHICVGGCSNEISKSLILCPINQRGYGFDFLLR